MKTFHRVTYIIRLQVSKNVGLQMCVKTHRDNTYTMYGRASQVSQMVKCRRPGLDPWVGKIPWRRKRQPTPVPLPGKFHGWRSLVGYSPRGRKELDTTEWLNWAELNWMYRANMGLPWWLNSRESACNAGDSVQSLGLPKPGRSLEKEMAPHSCILAWKIPWTEEPGGLQYMGSQESDMT